MGSIDGGTIYVYSDESWEALKAVCRRLPDTSISASPPATREAWMIAQEDAALERARKEAPS